MSVTVSEVTLRKAKMKSGFKQDGIRPLMELVRNGNNRSKFWERCKAQTEKLILQLNGFKSTLLETEDIDNIQTVVELQQTLRQLRFTALMQMGWKSMQVEDNNTKVNRCDLVNDEIMKQIGLNQLEATKIQVNNLKDYVEVKLKYLSSEDKKVRTIKFEKKVTDLIIETH